MDPTHDAERLEHLYKLQAIYRANLDALEVQLARAGLYPPTSLLIEIKETRDKLEYAAAAIHGAGAASALHEIGTEGQAQILDKALSEIRKAIVDRYADEDTHRSQRQAEIDRREYLIVALLIVVLAALLIHLLLR